MEAIKKTVVPLVCGFLDDHKELKTVGTAGSGFFINRLGHFVTAAHVLKELENMNAKQPCFLLVYVPLEGWNVSARTIDISIRWFKFTSCRFEWDIDVAVCQTTENPFTNKQAVRFIRAVRFGSFWGTRDGTPIGFSGFPLHFVRPVTAKGYVASYHISDKQIVLDRGAWPGASGSPVYVRNGRVIGMIVQTGVGPGIGLAYARPADFIMDFLRKNKIPYER